METNRDIFPKIIKTRINGRKITRQVVNGRAILRTIQPDMPSVIWVRWLEEKTLSDEKSL